MMDEILYILCFKTIYFIIFFLQDIKLYSIVNGNVIVHINHYKLSHKSPRKIVIFGYKLNLQASFMNFCMFGKELCD